MPIDPRSPVIAGVGQVSQRVAPAAAREPLALFADAARLADLDAGGRLLARVDAIATVQIVAWPYADPSRRLAERLGVSPRVTAVSTTGGNSPQMFINNFADRVARGELDVVLVGGAECIHTRWGSRKAGVHIDWSVDDGTPCELVLGDDRPGTNDFENAHGAIAPVNVYPLFETALRHASGRRVADHQQYIGTIWEHFAGVAAQNPYAWSRRAYSAAEIADATPDNRMVVAPYTKRMCANIDVDQGAAVLLCSYEAAKAAGVPDDKIVFLHAGSDAHDHWNFSERPDLAKSYAIRETVGSVLAATGADIDAIARFDFYSCFPSAVQMALDAAGLRGPWNGDSRPLTVTGGLPFAGGPVNNYPTHAIAMMVDALRRDPGSLGLTTALGWYVTKHSAAIWSSAPPERGFVRVDPKQTQARVDAVPAKVTTGAFDGTATIEATAIVMTRGGEPEHAIVSAITADGRRTLATTNDVAVMQAMVTEGWEGRSVDIRTNGTTNTIAGDIP